MEDLGSTNDGLGGGVTVLGIPPPWYSSNGVGIRRVGVIGFAGLVVIMVIQAKGVLKSSGETMEGKLLVGVSHLWAEFGDLAKVAAKIVRDFMLRRGTEQVFLYSPGTTICCID